MSYFMINHELSLLNIQVIFTVSQKRVKQLTLSAEVLSANQAARNNNQLRNVYCSSGSQR